MTSAQRPVLGGTDGFRGLFTPEVGPGRMNAETIAGLSHALVTYQMEAGESGPVVIARDTRPSGDLLSRAAVVGASSAGAEIIFDGIFPTPAAQKHAETVGAMATIVITASHNPAKDNGWKGMLGNRKPSKEQIRDISDLYWNRLEDSGTLSTPSLTDTYSMQQELEVTNNYVDWVVSDIETLFGRQPLRDRLFVIDGANGAASAITPRVFRLLGARVEVMSISDGEINKGCGAADLSGLKQFLSKHPGILYDTAFVGALANDGDADRVMGVGVTDSGAIITIDGNHIMERMATSPTQPGIVGTIYTNGGLRQRLDEQNIEFRECDNGDVHVTNTLMAAQLEDPRWERGGEFTGHLIDTSWLGSGDGVRAAAWIAALAATSGLSFGDIYSQQPMWPEVMSKLNISDGRSFNMEDPLIQRTLERVMKLSARPIVRASGTEPIVRIWTEAQDKTLAEFANTLLHRSVGEAMETN